MCSLMHVKAIGTKKSEILAKITFLGIFGQILPKAPIVPQRQLPRAVAFQRSEFGYLALKYKKWSFSK